MPLNADAQSIGLIESTSSQQQTTRANENWNALGTAVVAVQDGIAAFPDPGDIPDVDATNTFTVPQRIETYADTVGNEAGVEIFRGRGTEGVPAAVQAGDRFGIMAASGRGATGYGTARDAMVVAIATENHTDTAQGMRWNLEGKPNGSIVRAVLATFGLPTVVTGATTLTSLMNSVVVDSASPVTITMPGLATMVGGLFFADFTIVNVGAGAVTVDFQGSDATAAGATSVALAQGEEARIYAVVNNSAAPFWQRR